MKLRQLGRTGLHVSEIGFGAWGIGQAQWIGATDESALAALKAARQYGINFFDTALAYGDGKSEQLIAKAFGNSNDVVIASKVPPRNMIWPAERGIDLRKVFPKDYVLKSLDESLKNLARKSVDIYQFHVWSDAWASDKEWLATVDEMRSSGKVGVIGISINDHQPANSLKALATGLIGSVQVIYNIFDQSPEDELFPYCLEHGVGVIARVPFDEGALTGKITPQTKFPAGDFRNEYFAGDRKQQVWERAQKLVKDVGISIQELPTFALRFTLSHPAVSTVIPGMRDPRHVELNAKASELGPLDESVLKKLRAHRWVRNFYD